jgi:hypothetical protein
VGRLSLVRRSGPTPRMRKAPCSPSARYTDPPGRIRVARWSTMAWSWPPLWARTWRIITTSKPPGRRPRRPAGSHADLGSVGLPDEFAVCGQRRRVTSTQMTWPDAPPNRAILIMEAAGPQPMSATAARATIPAAASWAASAVTACRAIIWYRPTSASLTASAYPGMSGPPRDLVGTRDGGLRGGLGLGRGGPREVRAAAGRSGQRLEGADGGWKERTAAGRSGRRLEGAGGDSAATDQVWSPWL